MVLFQIGVVQVSYGIYKGPPLGAAEGLGETQRCGRGQPVRRHGSRAWQHVEAWDFLTSCLAKPGLVGWRLGHCSWESTQE
jgi:hypothetical protein